MSPEVKVDSVRSESSGTLGRAVSRGHGATLTLDSSARPQPDAFTNSEAFLGAVSSCGVTLIEMHAQETGVPLARMAVTIEGARDPAVPRYQSVHMRFELRGGEPGAGGRPRQDLSEPVTALWDGRGRGRDHGRRRRRSVLIACLGRI